nr:glycosyltransferase [Paenibacillus sp. ACRRX]
MEPHYTHCLEGRKQLNQLVGQFDYYVGDSEFNVEELANLHCEPSSVLPIVVDLAVKKQPNKKLDKEGAKFLFVGRVAPNKKHEDIIKVFNYYYTYIDPKATLYLVGDYNNYTLYYEKLLKLQGTLPCKNNVIFTGKVSGEELDFHYRTSDVLLCMSEHEGFCVPLLESMSYGIPTIAFDAGAIRSTMGSAGVKIIEKEYENIAELISYILGNDDLKNSLVNKQYEWLEQFTVEKTAEALIQIISRVEKL